MAFWSTKAAIAPKRVNIEEKLLWRAYRNSPVLFQMVPFLTLYGFCFPDLLCVVKPQSFTHSLRLVFETPTQNSSHYYLRNG